MLSLAALSPIIESLPANAQNSKKDITIFIPDTNWPPYLINDPQFPGQGVLIDVLKAVAEPMGYTVEIRVLPNKRGWLLLDKGRVDAHPKAMEWVQNPEKYLWTDPFMMNEDVLLYRAQSKLKYTTPEKLYGKTVTAIEEFTYPALEEHFSPKKINRVNVSSPFAMLELLDRERVDAALVNKSGAQWIFKNRPDLKPERFRMDDTPFDSAGYRYAFTRAKDWQPFIDRFNTTIKAMKKDGRLKAILDQYR